MKPIDDPQHDPLITAIMTMMLPGLGQMMKGATLPGILWALVVGFSYLAYIPAGIVAHALCVADAAFNKQEINFKNKNWLGKGVVLLVIFILIFYISYRTAAF